jgi:FdhD protein
VVVSLEDGARSREDALALEEPLEIRLGYAAPDQWRTKSISITMRTPGHDRELAAGFLFAEGIIKSAGEISGMTSAGPAQNVVRVDLEPSVRVDLEGLQRHFYTTSSCGVCGKASLDALSMRGCGALEDSGARFKPQAICGTLDQMRTAQEAFEQTGGLHAAALFDDNGELLRLREDVGRHNAVDKLIGGELLNGSVPLSKHMMVVSGRTSFELLQKTLAAGIPMLAAIGAPSSLAVELAREFDVTLVGFLKANRFNVYSAPWRIL